MSFNLLSFLTLIKNKKTVVSKFFVSIIQTLFFIFIFDNYYLVLAFNMYHSFKQMILRKLEMVDSISTTWNC